MHRKSTLKIGRTMSEKREILETASERAQAHKKRKFRKTFRIIGVTLGFGLAFAAIVLVVRMFSDAANGGLVEVIEMPYQPTIEVVDEAMGGDASHLTSRMREYIGQAESDFRDLGYTPVRAVIPAGAIREVDFYLEGWNGRIKMIVDRGTGVSVEDADRMLRYLTGIGVQDFEYIDVRVEGKGYWK